MRKEAIEKIENHIVAIFLAVIIIYIICTLVFGYDLPRGILSPLFN
ncbi:hypothetical protein [Metabacillus bambusae]|uniref:Uncharacterized protein n=1 Tax=Metabacillus bambusae TaxID=2795218 RepID=A0ABS3MWH2_9BACI|nr:hypothetical protein [Metabacillus bambusae]MBO1510245.1 hypothetical protein [Metabacillus bambusae]